MAARIKSLSDLRARISWIVLSAPDQFPTSGSFGSDQSRNLEIAFELVEAGFPLLERRITDQLQLQRLREMLRDALAAFKNGDDKKGAHLLQDFQDIAFPDRFEGYREREG